jgi:hypothetical protein
MLVGLLAVVVSSYSVLLGLFVFALFVMMDSLTVMVCRRLVVPRRTMVRFACGMFHCHDLRPFKEQTERRFSQLDLQKTRNQSDISSEHSQLIAVRRIRTASA